MQNLSGHNVSGGQFRKLERKIALPLQATQGWKG
jgi:hypothetical protein